MIEGQCLCGEVVFELDPDRIVLFNNCYCKTCQRNSGTGFVSQLQVEREAFNWLRGEQNVRLFKSSPDVNRAFCGKCGSRLPMAEVDGNYIPVPAGLLNDEFKQNPEVNMHLNDKAQWALIDESIHCLADQGTPEFWATFTEAKQNDS